MEHSKYSDSPFIENKRHAKTRDFLRFLFLYGCYNKKDFKMLADISDKEFNNYSGIIEEYLEDEKYISGKNSGKKVYRMSYDYYGDAENYLINSYMSKSSTKYSAALYFLIFQALYGRKSPMNLKELMLEIPAEASFDSITAYRFLEKLSDEGLIKKDDESRYSLKGDFFGDFSDAELYGLYHGVCFLSNNIFPNVPGYFLANTLEKYMKYCRRIPVPKVNIFLNKHHHFHPVLYEEYVLLLLEALNSGQTIRADYSKAGYKWNLKPLKLLYDINYGRWYLHARDEEGFIKSLRLDRINKLELSEEMFETREASHIPLRQVRLRVSAQNEYILKKFQYEGLNGEVTEDPDMEGFYIYTVHTDDTSYLKPIIRNLSPYVEVLEDDGHDLRGELKAEFEEMLKAYGDV